MNIRPLLSIIGQFAYQILIFLVFILPVRLIGYIILIPISVYMARKVYTANKSQVRLPKWCRWYDCLENYQPVYDNTLDWTNDDGLLGDMPYRVHRGTDNLLQCSITKLAYEIYIWLAIRNKTEYLCGVTLGFQTNWWTEVKQIAGDTYEIDDGKASGWKLWECSLSNGTKHYELYVIRKYWNFDKCFRLRLGHKVSAIGTYIKVYGHVMRVISINPINKWTHEI